MGIKLLKAATFIRFLHSDLIWHGDIDGNMASCTDETEERICSIVSGSSLPQLQFAAGFSCVMNIHSDVGSWAFLSKGALATRVAHLVVLYISCEAGVPAVAAVLWMLPGQAGEGIFGT